MMPPPPGVAIEFAPPPPGVAIEFFPGVGLMPPPPGVAHGHPHKGQNVLAAYYGAHINEVRSHLHPGHHFHVTNHNLGGDPCFGLHKELLIVFVEHGRLQHLVTAEGNHVHIPHHPIVLALYGNLGATINVTQQVRNHILHHRNFHVENSVFHSDPAVGHHKKLIVAVANATVHHVPEGHHLPLKAHALVVTAHYHNVDVTERITINHDGIHVTNEHMGGDPAPGVHKTAIFAISKVKTHKVHIREAQEGHHIQL